MPAFLEDFVEGQIAKSPHRLLSRELMESFPAEFGNSDTPTPMMVACLTMRLVIDSELGPSGGVVGAGIEELQWPTPARFGAEVHAEHEILEVRRSKSRPDRGLVRLRTRTLDETGAVLQSHIATIVVPARG